MLQIDERIGDDRVSAFADKFGDISPNVANALEQMLLWDQPTDFYYGQLAAFIWAHQLIDNPTHKEALLSIITLIGRQIICRKIASGKDSPNKQQLVVEETIDRSVWTAAKEKLPPTGLVVRTKIESDAMGEWCFIDRFYQDGRWHVSDKSHTQFEDTQHDPTHWQMI
jgi:hypothetical protein